MNTSLLIDTHKYVCMCVHMCINVYKRTLYAVMKKGRICFEACVYWNAVMPKCNENKINKKIFT